MTTHHGNEGTVKLSTNEVGEIKNFTVEQSVDVADDTAMGDTWRTHKVGTSPGRRASSVISTRPTRTGRLRSISAPR